MKRQIETKAQAVVELQTIVRELCAGIQKINFGAFAVLTYRQKEPCLHRRKRKTLPSRPQRRRPSRANHKEALRRKQL